MQGRVCIEGDLPLGLDAVVAKRTAVFPDYDPRRGPSRL